MNELLSSSGCFLLSLQSLTEHHVLDGGDHPGSERGRRARVESSQRGVQERARCESTSASLTSEFAAILTAFLICPLTFSVPFVQRRALCPAPLHHGDQVLQHERPPLSHEEGSAAALEDDPGEPGWGVAVQRHPPSLF